MPDKLSELASIAAAVAEFFSAPGFPYSAARIADCDACLAGVRRALPSPTSLNKDEIEAAGLAAIMGPPTARLDVAAGQAHVDAVGRLFLLPANVLANRRELAIAYGLGYARANTGGGWDGIWHGAAMAFFAMVICATERAQAATPGATGRDLDSDAGKLFEYLLRPRDKFHTQVGPLTSPRASTVHIERRSTTAPIELYDPLWPHYRPTLPGSAVKSFDVGDGAGLVLDATAGRFSFPDRSRVVIRSDPVSPSVDALPPSGPVRRFPVAPGGAISLTVAGHNALHAWRCLCGSPTCQTWHRFEAWQPDAIGLAEFVSRAMEHNQAIRQVRSMYAALCL